MPDSDYKPGQRIYLSGTVQQVYHPERGPGGTSYGIRLDDGQHVHTAQRNLREILTEPKPSKESELEPDAKAISAPPQDKAVRLRSNKAGRQAGTAAEEEEGR